MARLELLQQLREDLSTRRGVLASPRLGIEAREVLVEDSVRERVLTILNGIETLGFEGVETLRLAIGADFSFVMAEIDRLAYADRVRQFMEGIVDIPLHERMFALNGLFKSELVRGVEQFHLLVTELAKINLFDLIVQKRDGRLEADDYILALELDFELFQGALAVAQSDPRFEEWVQFLQESVLKQNGDKDGESVEEISLDGAALPEMFPKIDDYVNNVMGYMGANHKEKGVKFGDLTQAFKTMAEKVFGEEMEAFYTSGTLNTFKSLVLRFWRAYPEAEFISTVYDYMPMWYQVAPQQRHLIDLPDLEFSEEALVEGMIRKVEAIGDEQGKRDLTKPVVFGVSSQLRIGAKLLDTAKIAELVGQYNQRAGYKLIHLWFDASQDSRVIREGDVVFYSKRHAGTGGGMVLMNKQTYPKFEKGMEVSKDVTEAVLLRSGYDPKYIPRCIASMFATQTKFGHSFKDLAKLPGLWRFSGKGGFLSAEVEKATAYIEESTVLSGYFDLKSDLLPAQSDQWKVDAILRVIPTQEGVAAIDMVRLSADLKALDCDFSDFQLEKNDTDEGPFKIADLYERMMWVEDGEGLRQLIRDIEIYQEYYQSWIVKSLVPGERRDDLGYVKKYFLQAYGEHEYFRLFVSAINRPNYLLDFVIRLEQAVSAQLRERE